MSLILARSVHKGVEKMKYNVENDCKAIPYEQVQEVLDFLPYANVVRVMFEMLLYTGCRISELSKMRRSLLYDDVLFWHLGKNQKCFRKEKLPRHFLVELGEYWKENRICGDFFFGISGSTLNRYFNRDVRPFLSPAWQEKRLIAEKGQLKPEYILQLKGLRKVFQTVIFFHEYEKWKDSGVALEFTAKRMRHSTKHITAYHYLENFDAVDVEKFRELIYGQKGIILCPRQARLLEF